TDQLPGQVEGSGTEVTGTVAAHERDRVRAELEADVAVATAVDALWPVLTPEQFLEDLLGNRDQLTAALTAVSTSAGDDGGQGTSRDTAAPFGSASVDDVVEMLHRSAGAGWCPADIAL